MRLLSFLLLLPALAMLLFATVYPIIGALYYSLHSYNIITGEFRFTGFQEYLELLRDPVFQVSVRNTLVFSLAATFLQTFLGLSMAVIVNQGIRGRDISCPS